LGIFEKETVRNGECQNVVVILRLPPDHGLQSTRPNILLSMTPTQCI